MAQKYDGEEKRSEYCPVHHIKCSDIKDLQIDAKKRVPIWVFVIFVSAMGGVLGYMNYEIISKEVVTQRLLATHIEKSNVILNSMKHGLNEVALNQRTVMHKLDLEFEEAPRYD